MSASRAGAVLVGAALLVILLLRGVLPASTVEGGATRPDSLAALIHDIRPGLRAQARITPDRAWLIGRDALGGGTPVSGVLEPLAGRLVYVLLMREAGGSVREVLVDGRTGVVLSAPVAVGR
jgi:hypothetical protein